MLRTLMLGVMFVVSSTSYAKAPAVISMTQLEGSWTAVKNIKVVAFPHPSFDGQPAGDNGTELQGKTTAKSMCTIRASSDTNGEMVCDSGETIGLVLNGKKLDLYPRIDKGSSAFRQIVEDGWSIAATGGGKSYRILKDYLAPSAKDVYVDGFYDWRDWASMTVVSQKKLAKGYVFASGMADGNLCEYDSLGRATCLPRSMTTMRVNVSIWFTSLTRK